MNTVALVTSKNNPSIQNSDARESVVRHIAESVAAMLSESSGLEEFEKTLLAVSNEINQEVLQRRLEAISCRYESEYLLVNSTRYKRHTKGTVEYHSLCGTVKIGRWTYRQVGVRNGPTVVPLELAEHLRERATPALAYRIALGDAQCPGRQWEEQLLASHRRPPARSTLERIAKKLGETARQAAPEILPVVREKEDLPEEAVAVSVGLDRTTIPMEEKLRWCGDIGPQRRRQRPYVRKAPAPVEVNYRMAYVGTVSISGPDGRNLHTRRYGCSADQDPTEILDHMMADVMHIQQQRSKHCMPELPTGIVQDGAPEMWNLVEEATQKAFPRKQFEKAIDRYHLAERLAESLKALKNPFLNRDIRMREWSAALESNDSAIDDIERFIIRERNRSKRHNSLSAANTEILRTHLTYIKNNKHLMRYAKLKKKGLPTGSGATEGACKSLIMIRAKGCGQRWHSKGVNSVLTLRGLYQNERLAAFWTKLNERQTVNIQEAA